MAQACYYPDGTVGDDLVPCNMAAESSHCCHKTDICLSNRYCLNQDLNFGNRISRAGCSDQTWSSTNCPLYCREILPPASISLFLVDESVPGHYCCGPTMGNNNSICSHPTQDSPDPFELYTGFVITNRTSGSTGPNSTSVDAHTPTVTVTVTATSGSNTSVGEAAGAGVGAALGVLLLAGSALGFLQLKRRKQTRHTSQDTPLVTTADYFQDHNPQASQAHLKPVLNELNAHEIQEMNGFGLQELDNHR